MSIIVLGLQKVMVLFIYIWFVTKDEQCDAMMSIEKKISIHIFKAGLLQ